VTSVFTISSLAPETGGPSRSVPSLARALSTRGVEVRILSLHFGTRESPPLATADLPTSFIACKRSAQLPGIWTSRFQARLRQLLGQPNTLLHDTGVWLLTNHTAARVARALNVPRIVSPRGMLSPWALDYKRLKKKLAWWLYQHRDLLTAQAFHVTSIEECNEVRNLGFRQPIAVIPNGVEVPPAFPRPRNGSSTRTLLFLSRIHPKKGLTHLVEAWAALRPVGWRAVIAGPDEAGHQHIIEELIRARGLADQFSFIGPVKDADKWSLYRGADLFVLPTFSENFGLVIAEALAAGLPVITTKGTPWRELLAHHCGWWIDLSTENLAAALREAMRLSDSERNDMGQRGRKLIEQKYSWASIGEQMESFYHWLLHGGSRPSCVLD
jgi:glycosyltransferase involved in cell wall biosynthesis